MKKLVLRQRIRRLVILIFLLLFPITLNYFSPYVIIDGASQGIINGSFILFGLMFLLSLVFGRLWCAWVCPAACLQEVLADVNHRPVGGRLNWIKWGIWLPWIGLIMMLAVQAGGYQKVDFFHLTDNGISVTGIFNYIVYYSVISLFFILAVLVGRRAGCHTICWMAPFMILGRKLRNGLKLPALRLQAAPEACVSCHACTQTCPMSLPVTQMVQANRMENSECILCGNCIDGCAKKAIRYAFDSDTRH